MSQHQPSGYGSFSVPPPVAPPRPPGGAPPSYTPGGFWIDPASRLQLPDGTELASAGRRIGAYFLSPCLAIITLGIGYVIWGLVLWSKGTTPALRTLGCRVYRPGDQRPAGFGHMVLREVVGRFIAAIGPLQLVSLVLFLARSDRRALHDLVAGTVVIRDPYRLFG